MSLQVRIKPVGGGAGFFPPRYMSEGASGMDLCAHLPAPVVLKLMERRLIPCGFSMELPEGVEAQVRPRSGLAIRHGVTCLNSPGTIDHDYRGEVQVALVNHGAAPFTVARGMRIAQVCLGRVTRIAWAEAETLSPTARDAGGFGHSGL